MKQENKANMALNLRKQYRIGDIDLLMDFVAHSDSYRLYKVK